MSVPSRLMGMFTLPKKNDDKKLILNENISKGLILLCIELCKRKQAARVLDEIKSKECDKLLTLIENGNITSKNFNDIIDTNILWSCLIKELERCVPLISKEISNTIISDASLENISLAITNLPQHQKKLMGALIPTAEALGEGNPLLAEKILNDFGNRIIEPSNTGFLLFTYEIYFLL